MYSTTAIVYLHTNCNSCNLIKDGRVAMAESASFNRFEGGLQFPENWGFHFTLRVSKLLQLRRRHRPLKAGLPAVAYY
jgi:hypothetical protein